MMDLSFKCYSWIFSVYSGEDAASSGVHGSQKIGYASEVYDCGF